MSVQHYYHMCNRGVGRAVQIRTRDGRTHRGFIHRVTPSKVYLMPFGRRPGFGGYGYGGFWGWGLGVGIALGFIIGLAFIPFWW